MPSHLVLLFASDIPLLLRYGTIFVYEMPVDFTEMKYVAGVKFGVVEGEQEEGVGGIFAGAEGVALCRGVVCVVVIFYAV